MAKTPLEFVEKQWVTWQDQNPVHEHVDEEQLKDTLINDLTYASSMDVREYTLYQKWCEVKERYPIGESNPLSEMLGETPEMLNLEQKALIQKVKKNFWVPSSPDDYEKLEPIMQLHNGF